MSSGWNGLGGFRQSPRVALPMPRTHTMWSDKSRSLGSPPRSRPPAQERRRTASTPSSQKGPATRRPRWTQGPWSSTRRGRCCSLGRRKTACGPSFPGGWVDVGESPSESVEREVKEESGYEVRAVRLLALWDRNKHPHSAHSLPRLQALPGGVEWRS